MGQKTSRLRVHVEASLPTGLCRVDGITLSYSRATCWGRGRRRVARFTFPRQGWLCRGDVQVCTAKEGPRLPLATLQRKDGSTAVRVKCSSRGAPVYAASMSLSRLLALLEKAEEGGAAHLLFTLAGGDGTAPHGAAFTTMSCNGWQCGDGGDVWEYGGQGEAMCPTHEEGPSGTHASPGRQGLGHVEEGKTVPGPQEQHGPAQPDKASEDQQCPSLTGHCSSDDLQAQSEAPAAGTLALDAEEHPLFHQIEGHSVPDGTMSQPPTPQAYETVPAVCLRSLAWNTQDCDTVSETDFGVPSFSAQAYETVPEIDLGDPSSLAFFNDLHKTVPEIDLGIPSSSAQADETVPEINLGDPSSSARADETVPDIDLGDPSSLAFLNDLLFKTVPETDVGVPSCNAQACETVPELDPVPSIQAAACPVRRSTWVATFLDVTAVFSLTVSSVLILNELW